VTALLLLALLAEPAEMPLGFSLLPPNPVLEPPAPPVECTEDMTDFEPRPTPFEDTMIIPYKGDKKEVLHFRLAPGILLSECGFTKATNIKIEHRRLKLELAALRTLWAFKQAQWTSGEVRYQETIEALQKDLKEANAPSFWEEWDAPIVAAITVVLTVAAIWGTVEIYKAIAPRVTVQ